MLWSVIVTQRHHLFARLSEIDNAVIAPRKSRHLPCWQYRELPLYFFDRSSTQFFAHCNKTKTTIRIMLRLPQQVARDKKWISRMIGDDEYLGRPGQQVNATAPEELPFGFCDEAVACSTKH